MPRVECKERVREHGDACRLRSVLKLPSRNLPDVGEREEHGGLGDKARYESRGRDM